MYKRLLVLFLFCVGHLLSAQSDTSSFGKQGLISVGFIGGTVFPDVLDYDSRTSHLGYNSELILGFNISRKFSISTGFGYNLYPTFLGRSVYSWPDFTPVYLRILSFPVYFNYRTEIAKRLSFLIGGGTEILYFVGTTFGPQISQPILRPFLGIRTGLLFHIDPSFSALFDLRIREHTLISSPQYSRYGSSSWGFYPYIVPSINIGMIYTFRKYK